MFEYFSNESILLVRVPALVTSQICGWNVYGGDENEKEL